MHFSKSYDLSANVLSYAPIQSDNMAPPIPPLSDRFPPSILVLKTIHFRNLLGLFIWTLIMERSSRKNWNRSIEEEARTYVLFAEVRLKIVADDTAFFGFAM